MLRTKEMQVFLTQLRPLPMRKGEQGRVCVQVRSCSPCQQREQLHCTAALNSMNPMKEKKPVLTAERMNIQAGKWRGVLSIGWFLVWFGFGGDYLPQALQGSYTRLRSNERKKSTKASRGRRSIRKKNSSSRNT